MRTYIIVVFMAGKPRAEDPDDLTKRWSVNFKRYLYDCDQKDPGKVSDKEMHLAMVFDGMRIMLMASFERMLKDTSKDSDNRKIFDHAKSASLKALQLLYGYSPKESLDKAYAIGLERNHDYGQLNITTFGVAGLFVRIGDKAIRLHHLLSFERKPAAKERIEDTLIDIVNYATFGHMLIDNVWL